MINQNTILPNPFPGIGIKVDASVNVSTNTTQQKYKFKHAGNKGTLISVVLDESGSMSSCWDTTINGFNEFLLGQKTAKVGDGFLTLTKFSSPRLTTVFSNRPLNEVPNLDRKNYTPTGGTNLLDAIGKAINDVHEFLSSMKKKERPGVIITILTDGEENASRNFNNDQIKQMVKAAEDADWTFVFLGANIDAFAVGSTFGMSIHNSANYSTSNIYQTMASVSASTVRMRSAKLAGASTQEIYGSGIYTEQELRDMNK